MILCLAGIGANLYTKGALAQAWLGWSPWLQAASALGAFALLAALSGLLGGALFFACLLAFLLLF